MNCRRAQHLLFDFIDGLGNDTLRVELDRHLAGCPRCEQFAAEMSRSLSLLRRVPQETLDENFNWRVRLAIHREKNAMRGRAAESGAWARAWNMRYAAAAGVAFAVVLVAGVTLQRNGAITFPMDGGKGSPAMTQQDLPAREMAKSQRTAARTPVPFPSVASPLLSTETLVSGGAHHPGLSDGATPLGAIDDPLRSEAIIDSLVEQQLIPLAPAERAMYIRRHIERLQSRLQSQPAEPVER